MGGTNLRGFSQAGAGPRDTATRDALGGKNYVTATLETKFPLGLPEELGVSGALFSDAGYLAGIEEATSATVVDDKAVRVSVGVGIDWKTVVGPLRFDFAVPVSSKSYDRKEVFRFSFRTRF